MRNSLLFLLSILLLTASACFINKSSAREEAWVDLFNGRDIDDWMVKVHHHEFGINFANTFRVQDSIIQVRYDQYDEFNDQFGHLYYKTPYSYYHLKIDYRFVGELHRGAPSYTLRNSGVMFHSQDPRTMLKKQDGPNSFRNAETIYLYVVYLRP